MEYKLLTYVIFSSGAGNANYSELFWEAWDWMDNLYFAYQAASENEKGEETIL